MTTTVFSIQRPTKAKNQDDIIEERKERKRIQNRLNQRAYRQRNQDNKSISRRRPYKVERWRVDEPSLPVSDTTESSSGISGSSTISCNPRTQTDIDITSLSNPAQHEETVSEAISIEFSFPLSSDHLLHLIHHNVLRALLSNKSLLNTTAVITAPSNKFPVLPSNKNLCDGLTLIHSVDATLPPSLFPTPLQTNCPHSAWINMLPFAQMRDNLIIWENTFDHVTLCEDLFGEVVGSNRPIPEDRFMGLPSSQTMSTATDIDDEITTGRKGLIVWGEPTEPESWEVTPGFIKKWAWLLVGCEALILTSNRWRAARGESPIKLEDLTKAMIQANVNPMSHAYELQ